GRVEAEAGHASRRLVPLDAGAREARLLGAAAERIAHRDPEAPRRVVAAERLAERRAEAPVVRARDHARERPRADDLRAAQPVAAIQRLEADVGQALIAEERDLR